MPIENENISIFSLILLIFLKHIFACYVTLDWQCFYSYSLSLVSNISDGKLAVVLIIALYLNGYFFIFGYFSKFNFIFDFQWFNCDARGRNFF